MAAAERPIGRGAFTAGLAAATVLPLVLAPLLAPRQGRGTAETLGILVVVGYAGHVAVTGWLFTVPGVRREVRERPGRLVAVPAALVVAGVAAGMLVPARLVDWLLLGFFAWQFHHFQRQNVGLVAAVAARWEAEPLGRAPRRLVDLAGGCGIVALVARPRLLGLSGVGVPPALGAVAADAAGLALISCVLLAAGAALRSRRPTPVVVAQVLAVGFVAPVFLFRAPAAAVTGMVVAHGLQYLWMVGVRSHGARRPRRRREGWRTAAAVGAVTVVGGTVLAAMSALHDAAGGLRLGYGAYLGVVMAHFSLDGALWRRPAATPIAGPRRPILVPSPASGRV